MMVESERPHRKQRKHERALHLLQHFSPLFFLHEALLQVITQPGPLQRPGSPNLALLFSQPPPPNQRQHQGRRLPNVPKRRHRN
ncbi:hypothetical protein M0R45_014718 [Rubus argutus]|uniref:Uncharacterized protein n=1 Tax=Rubus argutus TaxID=59490 RepID=A0AAW1XNK8_RUBAR